MYPMALAKTLAVFHQPQTPMEFAAGLRLGAPRAELVDPSSMKEHRQCSLIGQDDRLVPMKLMPNDWPLWVVIHRLCLLCVRPAAFSMILGNLVP